MFSCPQHSPYTHTSPISWLYNCHLIQAYTNTCVSLHTAPQLIRQETQLYPAPCLTNIVHWTINASMDLGKSRRGSGVKLSISSVITVCDFRPGIKAAITQDHDGPKHFDQSKVRHTESRNFTAMNGHRFQNTQHSLKPFQMLPYCYFCVIIFVCWFQHNTRVLYCIELCNRSKESISISCSWLCPLPPVENFIFVADVAQD